MANHKPRTEEWKKKISKLLRGKKHTKETKKKISQSLKGKLKTSSTYKIGHKVSEEIRKKISLSKKGKPSKLKGRPSPLKGRKQPQSVIDKRISKIMGKNHPKWIKDRSQIKARLKGRRCHVHKQWSTSVKERDNYICKINNNLCCGKLYSHHILSFKEYPELRYDINNGITLCHYHHPIKRIDEVKHENYFKKLIN